MEKFCSFFLLWFFNALNVNFHRHLVMQMETKFYFQRYFSIKINQCVYVSHNLWFHLEFLKNTPLLPKSTFRCFWDFKHFFLFLRVEKTGGSWNEILNQIWAVAAHCPRVKSCQNLDCYPLFWNQMKNDKPLNTKEDCYLIDL